MRLRIWTGRDSVGCAVFRPAQRRVLTASHEHIILVFGAQLDALAADGGEIALDLLSFARPAHPLSRFMCYGSSLLTVAPQVGAPC